MAKYLEDWEHPASRFAQFYTQPLVAAGCMRLVLDSGLVPKGAFFVEPSAGSGAFYALMPPGRRFGCDIDPHPACPVLQADFLAYPLDEFIGYPFIAVVGNPPFGLSRDKGSMGSAFFNRCAQFADLIAFVLPSGYSISVPDSWSVELDPSFTCVSEVKLPLHAFNERSGSELGFRCVFQIWRRRVPRVIPAIQEVARAPLAA